MMLGKNKIRYISLLGLFFIITALFFSDRFTMAATNPDYHFEINSQTIKDNAEFELKSNSVYVYVATDSTWAPSATVTWKSTEERVVTLEGATGNYVRMVRKGPGYSNITADIKMGDLTYTISFLVKVSLEINYRDTNATKYMAINDKVGFLEMNTDTYTSQQIYLKYADEAVSTSGAAINVSFATFASSNTGVATVSDTGLVTAVSAGTTTITITSNTTSTTNSKMSATLTVVVTPKFSFSYSDNSGTHNCVSSSSNTDVNSIYKGVPSEFTINSNGKLGKNLNWIIYQCVGTTKTKITATSKLMSYSISDSGTVAFSKVKAGTYEIYACADPYTETVNVTYAYMKIYVYPSVTNTSIVMNVGDTYNIFDNSNLTDVKVFKSTFGADYDPNIAKLDASTFTLTAQREGSMTITLTYDTGQKLFEGLSIVPSVTITVTVINGIALSESNATIYVGTTLQLNAIISSSNDVIWSSNKTNFATVDNNGLVTGKGAGTATITATQTVNGVVKKATCEITVQQSVTSITVSPSTKALAINEYLTLHATVAPNTTKNVTLQWRTSNSKVVAITEPGNLTTTVQGLAGGTAVISAINQDNVVVGYCSITVRQPVTSVTLSETAVSASLSLKQVQLRATAYPENADNKNIIWSTTDNTKATVSQNGLVTLVKPGTVTIIATSEDNAAAVAYCNITITTPVSSVSLDETKKTMYVGQTARLSYSVLPATSSNSAVSWLSSNTAVATVDAGGLVAAKSAGSTIIMLKTLDGGYSVFCTLTVKQVATGIKFDVSDLKLKTGEAYTIKTTLAPAGSTDNSLVWESSDTKVAVVDDNGKVTAKSAGTAIIMAKTEAGGTAYCKVTITQAVKGLILNFAEKTIYKGEKFNLVVSVSPTSATDLAVTWKSSNTKVATISDKGEVTGLMGGVSVITCTTKDGGYSATSVVTVKEAVTEIKLNHSSYSLGVKKNFTLKATITNENATNQKVRWKSNNKKVAVVNQSGKVTGIAIGYATITAVATDGSEAEASCTVRIVRPASSISISKTTLVMFVGSTKKVKATIRPKNTTYKTAKWSSSDTSIAIVDSDGTIIAVKAGNATITAKTRDSSGKKAICYVTVRDRVAATSVTMQDKAVTMVPGETKMVNVVLAPANSTDGMTWSTDNNAVATVDKNSGKITARATGKAYITVMTASGKTATVEITVIGLNVTKLVTEEYTTYSSALSVEGATTAVTWRIDNPLIAVVSSDGTVSTRSVGETTITATVNGRKLKCKLIVNKMS
jgi:Bacterial surface proteins containing Ig-like domains